MPLFSLLMVLTACSNTTTIHCEKLGSDWIIEYNEEEVVKATENGVELTSDQLKELNSTINQSIENGYGVDIDDFMNNHYAVNFENEGGTCEIE